MALKSKFKKGIEAVLFTSILGGCSTLELSLHRRNMIREPVVAHYESPYTVERIYSDLEGIANSSQDEQEMEFMFYDYLIDVYNSINMYNISEKEKEWLNSISVDEKEDYQRKISQDIESDTEFMRYFWREIHPYNFKGKDFIFFKRIEDVAELFDKLNREAIPQFVTYFFELYKN